MNRFLTVMGAAAGFMLVAIPAFAAAVETPEPTSLGLLAAGIGSVAWAKFRGRK